MPSASWPIDWSALPPDWVQSVLATGSGRLIGSAVVAGSTVDVVLAGQDRDALAEDRRAACLALLEDAAAARGERGGDQQGDAESFDFVILVLALSYWAWAGWSAALMSTPSEPAS